MATYECSRTVFMVQGVYYLLSGAWPFVSISSFLAVTGPKTDLWLVYTVGALVVVMGATLFMAGLNRRNTNEVLLLGIGSAGALIAIDVIYTFKRVIAPIYLLDAFLELSFLFCHLILIPLSVTWDKRQK